MKWLILAISILCLSWVSNAQTESKVVDSLLYELSNTGQKSDSLTTYTALFEATKLSDSLKFIQYGQKAISLALSQKRDSIAAGLMYDLGRSLMQWGNIDASLSYFDTLITYSEKQDYQRGIASGYKGKGDAKRQESNFEDAIENYLIAIDKWEAIGDINGIAACYNNIGVVYRTQSNVSKALEYYFLAVEKFEEIGAARGLGYINNNIGNIYYEKKNYSRAITYYDKALVYNQEIGDVTGISFSLNNLGLVYSSQNDKSKAMNYFQQSLKLNEQTNYKEGVSLALINIAATYLDMGMYDSAFHFFDNVLTITKNTDDRQSETYALIGIADVEIHQKDFLSAREFLKKAVQLSQQIGYPANVVAGAERLTEVESELGNYRAALKAHVLFKTVSDSIFNEEETEKFVRINAENEFQLERDSLNFAQERERLVYETEIARTKTNQLLLIWGLVVVTIVIIIVVFYNRKLQGLNTKVTNQRDQLDQLNKSRSRLFSIVAHDLRGPMTILLGYGDLIKREVNEHYKLPEESDLNKLFGYLNDTSKSVMELMNGLLTWALKEENGFQLQPSSLRLSELVEKNFELFSHQARVKNISLISNVSDNLEVYADRNSLLTIIRNLTGNAIKFTPQDGSITLSAYLENNCVAISVTDTGVGIAKEKTKGIFEINEQKISQGTQGEKGTGLGLNLVYDFVQLNKGTIELESEVGKGTTFKMSFPASI